MNTDDILITAVGVKKYVREGGSFLPGMSAQITKAFDDVSIEIRRGGVLGLVGESGCGKSTLGLSILRLHDVTDGQVFFNGSDIFQLNRASLRRQRKDMQIIFQTPTAL